MPTDTFSAAGPHSWQCPVGVTSVDALCFGAGGGGAGGGAGGGGGGGAYAASTGISVTPGNFYSIVVGAGGTGGSSIGGGGDAATASSFDTSTVVASGGAGGPFGPLGGSGGLAVTSTGSTKYSGGDGATLAQGQGGGSSAGTASAGTTATTGTGGVAPSGGGDGGNGGATPTSGSQPGGGGGGGGSGVDGATGGDGFVSLTYTVTSDGSDIGRVVVARRRNPGPPSRANTGTALLEPTPWTEPTAFAFVMARGIVPPSRRPIGVTLAAPVNTPPDQLPPIGWLQPVAANAKRTPPPPPNRSTSVRTFEPGATSFESWAVVKAEAKRVLATPRRPFFAVPTDRLPPFPDSWLTVSRKAGLPPPHPRRPVIAFTPDFTAEWPQAIVARGQPQRRPPSRAVVVYVRADDGGAAVVVAKGKGGRTLFPSRTRIVFDLEGGDQEGLASVVMVKGGKRHPLAFRLPFFTRPLEPTGTGVATLAIQPTTRRAIRPLAFLRRPLVFWTPETIVRILLDDRDSAGASTRTVATTGGSGFNRSARGTGSNTTGDGRPPNP